MFSNVFFGPTRFVWPGTFGIRSMRFAPPRLLPCHHQITSNHVLRHARKNIQKTPKVKNIIFLKNNEKSSKVKEFQFSRKHENPQNPTPRTLTILIMRLKNLKIREHVLTIKRISAEFLFSRFTTEMKRSNRRIMLLGTVAVGAQRS